jgi:Holliday junction DNA helicase RuvA
MISYLRGKISHIQKINNRLILILEVNQIGYEIQIPTSLSRQFAQNSEEIVQIFTHLQTREDQQILYGFNRVAERDLFRQLLNVNGVGAQLGIALIDTLGLEDLVQAIVKSNSKKLIKTPGVGVKIAERIILELKSKLAQGWLEAGVNLVLGEAAPPAEVLEDLEMTLLALGYSPEEINRAISELSQDHQTLKNAPVEEWIRSAIAWLG